MIPQTPRHPMFYAGLVLVRLITPVLELCGRNMCTQHLVGSRPFTKSCTWPGLRVHRYGGVGVKI